MDDDQEWAQLVAYEQYNTCDKRGGEMRVVSVSPRKGYYEVRLECPSCEYGLRVRVRPLDIAARKTVGCKPLSAVLISLMIGLSAGGFFDFMDKTIKRN